MARDPAHGVFEVAPDRLFHRQQLRGLVEIVAGDGRPLVLAGQQFGLLPGAGFG